MDMNGVLQRVYDKHSRRIGITVVEQPASAAVTRLEPNEIWARVYDAASDTIRVVIV